MAGGDDLARLGRGWAGLGAAAPGILEEPEPVDPDAETIQLVLGEEELAEGPPVADRTRQDRAERLVRQWLRLCEHPRTRKHTLALIQSSVEGSIAGQRLLRLLGRLNRGQFALTTPERVLATQVVTATLAGLAVSRYIRPVEPLASAEIDDVVAIVAPAVRAALASAAGGRHEPPSTEITPDEEWA